MQNQMYTTILKATAAATTTEEQIMGDLMKPLKKKLVLITHILMF